MNELAGDAGIAAKQQLDKYFRCVEPGGRLTVCLKLEMVGRLQVEVLRGISFMETSNEVGGILLGRTEVCGDLSLTFVDDFQPVPSTHRNGPSYPFALTDKDVIALERALARVDTREAPSVVGYYRSHTRGGLFLSLDDLRLIQRYFRVPQNLFLLIKPLPDRTCTAGLYFWKNGQAQSELTGSNSPLTHVPISSWGRVLVSGESVRELPVVKAPAASVPPEGIGISRRWWDWPAVSRWAVVAMTAAVILAVFPNRQPRRTVRQTPVAPVAVPLVSAASERREPVSARPKSDGPPAPFIPRPAHVPVSSQTMTRQVYYREDGPKAQMIEPAMSPSTKPLTAAAEHPPLPAAPAIKDAMAPLIPAPPAIEKPASALAGGPAVTPADSVARMPATLTDAIAPVAPPAPAPTPRSFVGPEVIHSVPPAVPRGIASLITADVQVDVTVAIDAEGKVTSARLSSTRGGAAAGLLTIEALKAAQLFRFRPARENGRSVPSSMLLTFRFARTDK